MERKHILIFISVFAVILAVSAIVFRRPSNVADNPPTPTPREPSLPTGKDVPQPDYSFGRQFSFPEHLPLYDVVDHASVTKAENVASSLGFPLQNNASGGDASKTIRYSAGDTAFTITPSSLNIYYFASYPTAEPLNRTKEQLENDAQAFIDTLSLYSAPISLKTVSVAFYGKENESSSVTSQNVAVRAEVRKKAYIDSVPFYVSKPDAALIETRIGSGGGILSFRSFLFPTIAKRGETTLDIIPYEEARLLLQQKKGVLLSLVSAEASDVWEIVEEPPASVIINEAELSYFYSGNESALPAVYVFRGTGLAGEKKVNTVTVLTASRPID